MNKTQTEMLSQTAKAEAMSRKIDQMLRASADEQTRKALQEIITAGLDAYHATRSGL